MDWGDARQGAMPPANMRVLSNPRQLLDNAGWAQRQGLPPDRALAGSMAIPPPDTATTYEGRFSRVRHVHRLARAGAVRAPAAPGAPSQ